MARNFTVSFNITGAMDGSLQSALANASKAMRGLGEAARAASNAAQGSQLGLKGISQSLNALQAAANKYQALRKEIEATKAATSTAVGTRNSLAAQLNKDKEAAEQLKSALDKLYKTRSRIQEQQAESRATLQALIAQRAQITAAKGKILAPFDKDAYAFGKIPTALLGTAKGKELSDLLKQQRAVKQALDESRQKFRETASELKTLSTQIAATQREYRAATKTVGQSTANFDAAKNNAAQIKSQLQSQVSALQALKSQLSTAGFSTAGFVESQRQLESEINRVTNALNREQAALARRQRMTSATQQVATAGAEMWGAAYTAEQIASPFKSSLDNAVEFERVMSEVKALTQMDNLRLGKYDVVEREMAALTAQAKELGETTIYTSKQVGEAQAFVARTGWNTQQILGSIPVFLELAASQNMDIARTADLATNIMTAFGHNMKAVGGDADKFAQMIAHDADVFAYTVTHSNQNFEQFGEAMSYAAPVAKPFGASIEETAMMTKFMGDAGIQGSRAGTAMRMMMLRLVKPTKQAAKALAECGMTLDDATKARLNAQRELEEIGGTLDDTLSPGRQFIEIMKQIDKGMAGFSDQEKLAKLAAITGVYAVSGAANLFGAGAAQAENFTELLENCEGALNQTYQVMVDNTFGAQKAFESAWDAVQLEVGASLNSIARSGYEFITPYLIGLSRFIEANPAVVQAIAAIAGALAGLLVMSAAVKLAFAGYEFIASTFLLISGAATTLRTALAGLTLANIGAGISGAVGMFGRLGSAILGAARAAMLFVFTPIGAALTAIALAGLWVYNNWSRVAPVLSNIANTLGGPLSSALSGLGRAVGILGTTIINALSPIMPYLGKMISFIGGGLAGTIIGLAGTIASLISGIVVAIAGLLSALADVGTGLVQAFEQLASGDFSGAFETIKATCRTSFADMKATALNTFAAIQNGIKATAAGLDELAHPVQIQAEVSGGGVGAMQARLAEIDTSNVQAAVDSAGSSLEQVAVPAQAAGTGLQGIAAPATELAATMPSLPPELSNVTSAAQTTAPELTNVGNAAMTASPNLDATGVSAGNAATGLDDLVSAAAAVAGALQAKAGEISAIVIKAPQVQTYTISVPVPQGAAVTTNYAGGIYKKGAFLTTFAEKSPEAAIPLDKSKRARDLWTTAGQILGLLPGRTRRTPLLNAPPFDETINASRGIVSEQKPLSLPKPNWIDIAMKLPALLPGRTRRTPLLQPKFRDIINAAQRQSGQFNTRINRFPPSLKRIPMPQFPNCWGDIPSAEEQSIGSFPRLTPSTSGDLPTINLTVNVTINGNGDEGTVRRGIESSLPVIQKSFAEQWREMTAEKARRSFR